MSRSDPLPAFDLYGELGVPPTAGRIEIEAAWRAEMRRTHPDVAGATPATTARAARLNIARDWLLDQGRRATYDEIRVGRTGPRAGPQRPLPDIDPLGPWPARRRAHRTSGPGAGLPAALGTMAVLVSLVLGPGSIVAGGAFLLGVLLLTLAGLMAFFTLFATSR
jgi:hypothetical protein